MSSCSIPLRKWWNDSEYQDSLTSRADAGSWFVVAGNIPGRVVKIVYAGYKIQLPDDSTLIVNPDKQTVIEVPEEEYLTHVAAWNVMKAEEQRLREQVESELQAFLLKQSHCLHESSESYISAAAAGCDIYDTVCNVCEKVLRRSWATASDKDPDDHISDWQWWVRECQRLYKKAPTTTTGYKIVESISSDGIPSHHRRPRP